MTRPGVAASRTRLRREYPADLPGEGWEARLEAGLRAVGAGEPGVTSASAFVRYLKLILRWNALLNLTSIRDPAVIVDRHLIESAFTASRLPAGPHSVLDFGSGAGLPGIPIALCRPDLEVTLAESHARKAAFLSEALRELGRPNLHLYHGRVERMPAGAKFDLVTLRAVEKMSEAVLVASRRTNRWLAIMTVSASEQMFKQLLPEFSWAPAMQLPASSSGILLIGERTGDVPRGT